MESLQIQCYQTLHFDSIIYNCYEYFDFFADDKCEKDRLILIDGDKRKRIRVFSISENFTLLSEHNLDEISRVTQQRMLRFDFSNNNLFILDEETFKLHMIEFLPNKIFEKHQLQLNCTKEDTAYIGDLYVGYNGYEVVVFNGREMTLNKAPNEYSRYIDVFYAPRLPTLYGLCRSAVLKSYPSKGQIECLKVPKAIEKELISLL